MPVASGGFREGWRGAMRRFLLGAVGAVLVLVALAAATSAGWLLSVFGTDGRYEAPVASVDVGSTALYVNLFTVSTPDYVPRSVLETYVTARHDSATPLFLGVGSQEDVQDFLLGVPYDAASSLTNGTFELRAVPGLRVPAPAPESVDWWWTSASGNPARLPWAPENGAGVFVLMNADGSAGVDADVSASLEFPQLTAVVAVLVLLALVLGFLGALLVHRAVRSQHAEQ